jgi:rRNA-processing protein FCF1
VLQKFVLKKVKDTFLIDCIQEGLNNMEDLDKILSEAIRKTVKESLEIIKRKIFIMNNNGTKNVTYRKNLQI